MRTTTMRAFRFLLVAAPVTLALTGCELIAAVDHDLIGSGGSGAGPSAGGAGAGPSTGGNGAGPVGGEGGVGGTGGSGGSECEMASRCRNPPACQTVECNAETCEPGADIADGTKCEISVGVDGVCSVGAAANGDGSCVECIGDPDCLAPSTCDLVTNACVAPGCSNTTLDNDETDVDCGDTTPGAPSCNDCANGLNCLLGSDCISGFCNPSMDCAVCTMNNQCAAAEWCDTTLDGGTCVPDKADGQACVGGGGECVNGNCNAVGGGSSMCCNVACDGICSSCAAADTGGTNGTCTTVTNASDPTNDCADLECTTGLCQAGACAVEPNTVDCGTAATCAGDSLKPQDMCSGSSPACTAGVSAACTSFFSCNAAATPDVCFATCAAQGNCATGAYCGGVDGASPPANACADKKASPGICLVNLECESSSCGVAMANQCDP